MIKKIKVIACLEMLELILKKNVELKGGFDENEFK